MFSPEQYRALHEGAGLVDGSDRGQLSFTGADRLAFLQGLLTNDVQALEPGSGCYAALLTANGRMIADMRVFELGDTTLMDVDAGQAAAAPRALRSVHLQRRRAGRGRVGDACASWASTGRWRPGAGGGARG